MATSIRPGAVIFARDQARLAQFYRALGSLARESGDDSHTVLGSATFELVLHALSGEPPAPSASASASTSASASASTSPSPREDACVKLFFPVASLAHAREQAATLGGRLHPPAREWVGRGFRACDGVDPEGNVIQCREPAA